MGGSAARAPAPAPIGRIGKSAAATLGERETVDDISHDSGSYEKEETHASNNIMLDRDKLF
jgi:hypothetical protein